MVVLTGCGSSDEEGGEKKPPGPPTTAGESLGEQHPGVYHLGPVDFAETEWHNACAPGGGYRSSLEDVTGLGGEYLAGLSNEHNQGGAVCDACILITTATGRSIVARVVTYGVETGPNDIDVSPTVFDTINTGENPRSMTWEFAKCPDTGTLRYEFKMGSNPYWTALWVRNPRVPITNVEVQSEKHASFTALAREGDGTVVDAGGFGNGEFTLRVTGMDGQSVTETLPSFAENQLVTGSAQFE
ncbi:MAG TPA: expansin EXLX1 family cellulose-binding protein [Polyangiaceae bacterium]